MGLEAPAFRGLQALDHSNGRGDGRLLVNLILDAGYQRQPFDHEAAEVVVSPDGAWQRDLHALLANHGAFGSRATPSVRTTLSEAERGQTRRARPRGVRKEPLYFAAALALALVALAAFAVEATPLLANGKATAHTASPRATATPTATLVPTATPTPTPTTVVSNDARYSITVP